MAQTAIITVSTIGPGTGPFNLYSLDNLGVVTGPFEIGVTRVQLLNGYVSFLVPDNATGIRVVSTSIDCPLTLNIYLNIITTTTTQTPVTTSTTTEAPTTTSTTTSTTSSTTTTTAPGVPIVLGSELSGSNNCSIAAINYITNPTTYYLVSGCLSLSLTPPCNVLYLDAYLTSVAADGMYSDGINCYEVKAGVVNQITPAPTTTTTASTARPAPFNMYDCTGRLYQMYSNCENVGLGCYLYQDIMNTPVLPGIYMLNYDPAYGGFQTNLSGLIFNTNTCFS